MAAAAALDYSLLKTAPSSTRSPGRAPLWSRRPTARLKLTVPACGWITLPASKPGDERLRSAMQAAAAAGKTDDGCSIWKTNCCAPSSTTRGEMTSLWDKETERETWPAPGNRLCLYKDVPDNWDAWDLDSMAEMQPVTDR